MRKVELTLLTIFILSRLIFINTQPIFFDSQEYLDLFAEESFSLALTNGHVPQHLGHILLYWPIYQLTNSPMMVILAQVILSTITLIAFYRLVRGLTSKKKVALIACILVSLMPMWWISTTTIMMESTYVSSFILCLYFLRLYAESPRRLYAGLTVGLGAFCIITQPITMLWLPVIAGLWFYQKQKVEWRVLGMLGLMVVTGLTVSLWAVSTQRQTGVWESILILFLGKKGELAQNQWTLMDMLRLSRNALIPLIKTQTLGLVTIGFMGLILLGKTNKRLVALLLSWILPFVIVNQFWDALFQGRHALLSGFGLAIGAAYFLRNKWAWLVGFLIYMVMTSIPAMMWLHKPIPYLELQKATETLPSSGLLIVSHFARPQIQGHYEGETIYVNEPVTQAYSLSQKIDGYLAQNLPVFISSDALSEPYGLYTGPYLHNLTLSYIHEFVLKSQLTDYEFTSHKIIDKEYEEVIYQISQGGGEYPPVVRLTNHRRRIDYTDPLTQIWLSAQLILQKG